MTTRQAACLCGRPFAPRGLHTAVARNLRPCAVWTGRNAWTDRPLGRNESPLALPVMLLMLVLALVGVGAAKNEAQRGRAWMVYLVLLLFPLPFALTHAASTDVLRVAVDPLLLVLAAYAIGTLLSGGRVARPEEPAPEPEKQDDLPPGIPMARLG